MFTNISTASVYIPRVSLSHPLPLQETLQDQQVGLAQGPIKLLLLPWVPMCKRFCVCPLKVKSVSPSPVGLQKLSPTALQSQMLWGAHLPHAGPLGWGA